MAGSLKKIDEEIVTAAVASVTLTGINSTYDVYMVSFNNLECDTDNEDLEVRFTASGTPDTSSNYDRSIIDLRADATFNAISSTNANVIGLDNIGTATGEQTNGILYLFNFNNASEYSFCTFLTTGRNSAGALRGKQGGAVLTVAQATDGIQFFMSGGNIDNGKFTLYGLKK